MEIVLHSPAEVWALHRPPMVKLVAFTPRRARVYWVEYVDEAEWRKLTLKRKQVIAMGFFDKQRKLAEDAERLGSLHDDQARKKFPILTEVMETRKEGGGGDTGRCSLSIFVQEGMWKAILRDKAESLCLWVSAPALDKLFSVLEASLQNPDTVWRADRFNGAEVSSRKKKK